MADSDGEYVADGLSDDDLLDHTLSDDGGGGGGVDGKPSGTSTSRPRGNNGKRRRRKGERTTAQAWEKSRRTWETNLPEENADGVLQITALEAEKRRRLLRDTTPLQRGIIRHLVLVLDMSFAMTEKDMLPTRYRLVLGYAAVFVADFLEQNPISQVGIVGMRDGVAVSISHLSGDANQHVEKLSALEKQDPQGSPSLQNALEMCRGALYHAPSHGTREVLIVYGALLSSDPGDIHETIDRLVTDGIRVSVVGLSAQVSVCAQLCSRTNTGDDSHYRVALDESHLLELLLSATTPPATAPPLPRPPTPKTASPPLPEAITANRVSSSWASPRESAPKPPPTAPATAVPSATPTPAPAAPPACAASLRNVLPAAPFPTVPAASASASASASAPTTTTTTTATATATIKGKKEAAKPDGVSESGRYACEVCGEHFCIDCDVLAHTVVHNCPGCQSGSLAVEAINGEDDSMDTRP
ncbi:transcription initiation factor TFIIH subunit 2 [Ophiocordyceps camponoti-floridani]|uniref:General transcription and DNA repair factor IIH n=1 Tax=Ophiocordyceps camponoti-floridani TaxID=2030778 RepID=A0A8H4Q3W0_9HYPO|nr:transcription initiation factor TFIIH subunit 2 [Ophiocordyceps camponoti-floridani]